jgi:V8-like Glu-specific endopeptidase
LGTGFLIAPDLVLTAAHNIYEQKHQKDHQDILFYPGASGKLSPASAYKVINMRFPEEFKKSENGFILHDYALLKLDRKVPREEYL